MILSRFFKSKRAHTEPEAQRQALHSLAADDSQQRQLAGEHSDPATRRAALAQLTDLKLLRQIGSDDPDAGVREYAQARLRKLLSGRAEGSPPLSDRLALLNDPQPLSPEFAEQLVRQGNEPELRLALLPSIQRDEVCAELAVHDPVAKVRAAALERVQTPALLEDIARRTRNRDKRISRSARERLQALNAERNRQDELEQLCNTMETLQWDGETGPNAARFAQLEAAWQTLCPSASATQRSRFQQAHDRYVEYFRASAAARAARQALCQRLQYLLAVLQDPAAQAAADEAMASAELASVSAEWAAQGSTDDADSRRLQRQFDELYERCQQQLAQLQRDQQLAADLQALISAGEQLLQRAGQVLGRDLSELQRRWKHQPQPGATVLRNTLQEQFERVLGRLHQRLEQQSAHKAEEIDRLEAMLAALEQALTSGELARAIECQQQAEQQLAHNIALSRQQMADFASRLQAFQPRIAELRGWRRWGTNRSRESLIEEVESLPVSGLEVVELARQIQAARSAWKEMDRTGGGAPRSLWKRFDNACEQAYAPVRAHQQALAEQRQQYLEQRQALCAEMEQLHAATDWSGQPDWRELSRAVQRFQQRWHQLGPVERRQRKPLERRFQTALEALQQHLRPQLERDLARRQQLIEQARTLAEQPDSHTAVDEIKRLQDAWQPRVLASRREEQALWKAFRGACDQIFAHRQAVREAQASARQANLERRQSITAAIDEMAALPDDQLVAAQDRYWSLCDEWHTLTDIPRRAQRDSEQQFRAACDRFEIGLRRQQQAASRSELARLAARAVVCERAEALLAGPADPAAIAGLEVAWATAPEPDAAALKVLGRRFERACQALRSGSDACRTLLQELAGQQQRKRELCLRLEIAAGVATPEEYAHERMQYQVARLSDSLSRRTPRPEPADSEQQALWLLREWYLCPLGPDNDDLTQRFTRAYRSLWPQSD